VTSPADTELLRARWRRVLKRHAIDTINRDDFVVGGLAARLQTPSVQLLVLPADPEVEVLHLDDALWAWLEAQKSVNIDGRVIRFGDRRCPTAHAAALVDGYGTWKNYLAVHRSGAIELGLGDRGWWERENREGELVRVFNLISIVVYTWAVLRFGAAHYKRLSLTGPWHLTIAARGAEGALLGNLGEGWAEPGSFENSVGGCVEQNLLWHRKLQDWPEEEEQQQVAFAVGDRFEDAWGVSQRRYLARCGDRVGRLDLRHIAE
jgi:hypothetical protein